MPALDLQAIRDRAISAWIVSPAELEALRVALVAQTEDDPALQGSLANTAARALPAKFLPSRSMRLCRWSPLWARRRAA